MSPADKTIRFMEKMGFSLQLQSPALRACFFNKKLGVNSGWQRGETLLEVIYKAAEKAGEATKKHASNATRFPAGGLR